MKYVIFLFLVCHALLLATRAFSLSEQILARFVWNLSSGAMSEVRGSDILIRANIRSQLSLSAHVKVTAVVKDPACRNI